MLKRELQAIVDRLPKTEDNVPVGWGDTVWHPYSEDGITGPNSIVVYGKTEDDYWLAKDGSLCNFPVYSTFEAALEAKHSDRF